MSIDCYYITSIFLAVLNGLPLKAGYGKDLNNKGLSRQHQAFQ